MKHILICDDHPTIRQGAKAILSAEFSGADFGEAASAAEALKKIKEKDWDIMILDVDMPGRSGLEVLEQLKAEKIKLPVLMFSMHPQEQIAVRALKLGAYGYVSKNAADTELAEAVRTVFSGRKYITQQVSEQMASYMENPFNIPPHELLSPREYQTMLLMSKGKTVSQIAKELSLGVPTVSTYRARILEKMGMKTSAELVNYAIRNKLT